MTVSGPAWPWEVGAGLAAAGGSAPELSLVMLNESVRKTRETFMVCEGYRKTCRLRAERSPRYRLTLRVR